MAAIDFITAFGKLLHDGRLRERFAHDAARLAESLDIRPADRAQFCGLVADDVEFQAKVLLRKRFALVSPAFPLTCSRLENAGSLDFFRFARSYVPPLHHSVLHDRAGFAAFLRRERPTSLCPGEANRAQFAAGQNVFFVRFVPSLLPTEKQRRRWPPGLQVFFRMRSGECHEWRLTVC